MRQTPLKHYPVVHIASHFRFQPGNDTNSFLVLGDGGHLTLAELKTSANLFGGVQLLLLSRHKVFEGGFLYALGCQ
jgi:CHAT domain-containing protein